METAVEVHLYFTALRTIEGLAGERFRFGGLIFWIPLWVSKSLRVSLHQHCAP